MPTVACPHCHTPVPWTPSSKFRPFCSERCRDLDLGAWANEEYRIAHAEPPEHDGYGDLPPGPRDDYRR